MDTPYPSPLPARWAALLGVLGTALAAAGPALPWADAAYPVAVLGWLTATVGGLSAAPPRLTEGRPLVQGTFLTVATVALVVLHELAPSIPAGWPQSVATAAGALLLWATGGAMPHLGATANLPPSPLPAPVPPELRGLGATLDPPPPSTPNP